MTTLDPAAAERLASAADLVFAALGEKFPEQVADAHALIALDPSLRGMVALYVEDGDRFDFVWTGRYCGSVGGAFVRGELGASDA